MFFVNLPLRYILEDENWLGLFIERGLPPELGLDAIACDLPGTDWHRSIAARLAAARLPCAVHLPFDDLRPASADPLLAEASRRRLLKAQQIARIYAPRHMIGHPSFSPPAYPAQEPLQFQAALLTWTTFRDAWPGHPLLALENTHDTSPRRLAALVATLHATCPDATGSLGVCLDTGHWHSFAKGHAQADQEADLDRWFDSLGPYIRHCHLHDNSGAGDEHKGLGQGSIPWDSLLDRLARLPHKPTATLEPHTEDALLASLEYIARHRARFEAIFQRIDD